MKSCKTANRPNEHEYTVVQKSDKTEVIVMVLSSLLVRSSRRCRAVFATAAMLVALGVGSCASPMGVSDRSPLLGGTQDDPPRAETMKEFVGLPRPN